VSGWPGAAHSRPADRLTRLLTGSAMNTLENPSVAAVLHRLHAAAADDGARWHSGALIRTRGACRPTRAWCGWASFTLPCRRRRAFVVSAGPRDTGPAPGGVRRVLRCEHAVPGRRGQRLGRRADYHRGTPDKCRALRANLAQAGLADRVTLLEGTRCKHSPICRGRLTCCYWTAGRVCTCPCWSCCGRACRPAHWCWPTTWTTRRRRITCGLSSRRRRFCDPHRGRLGGERVSGA